MLQSRGLEAAAPLPALWGAAREYGVSEQRGMLALGLEIAPIRPVSCRPRPLVLHGLLFGSLGNLGDERAAR